MKFTNVFLVHSVKIKTADSFKEKVFLFGLKVASLLQLVFE